MRRDGLKTGEGGDWKGMEMREVGGIGKRWGDGWKNRNREGQVGRKREKEKWRKLKRGKNRERKRDRERREVEG